MVAISVGLVWPSDWVARCQAKFCLASDRLARLHGPGFSSQRVMCSVFPSYQFSCWPGCIVRVVGCVIIGQTSKGHKFWIVRSYATCQICTEWSRPDEWASLFSFKTCQIYTFLVFSIYTYALSIIRKILIEFYLIRDNYWYDLDYY